MLLLLSITAQSDPCADFFLEIFSRPKATSLYPLYQNSTEGIERIRLVGQNEKKEVINIEIEQILTLTGAGKTRLHLRLTQAGSPSQDSSSGQEHEIYLNKKLLSPGQSFSVPVGTAISEIYKIEAGEPSTAYSIKLNFLAIDSSASLGPLPHARSQNVFRLNPEFGKPSWKLLSSSITAISPR